MRHAKRFKKLGRNRSQRTALLSIVTSSLLLNEYIVTTDAKAKECKRNFEKLVTLAKKGNRRRVSIVLKDKFAVSKLFDVFLPKVSDKNSGFVSIYKVGKRKGDDANLSKLVLYGSKPVREKKKKVKVKAKKKEEVKKTDEKTEEKSGVFGKMRELQRRLRGGKGNDQVSSKSVEKKSRSGL